MSHFRKRFALLKRPAFLAYVISFFSAAIGNGLGYIAMSWIVVTHYSSVTAMAILMACFWGPNILLGPFMGVLADRLPRKWLMFTSNLIRACVYITFSFYLRSHFHVATVYWMMFCSGVSFSAFYACASAFTRELVPPKELLYAVSIIDIIYEMGNMIGMGFAGLLIAWTSPETAVLVNGIAFIIATSSMLFIRKKPLHHVKVSKGKKAKFMRDFQDGLRYLIQRKKLLSIYTIQLLIFITYLTTPLLLVPFSKSILHATVEQFGIIEAFASVGIVIGGLFMPFIAEKFGMLRTLLFFCATLFFTFMLFGYNRSINLASVMYFIIGFSGAIWPLVISKAQTLTDIDFQGRVQSTFNSLSGIMMMAFYLSIGTLGKHFGVSHLYFIEVAVTALAIIFLIQSRRQFDNIHQPLKQNTCF
ncbi:MAG: hypothetical protein A3F13_01365 [Gammaproteobacteria bacterium RIFCSPHIGHO2_12_FULL_40_19]|nr:MAG: hypothetical protein A3F13_01365 [Gammaproteobacteria bacterium RIFCSPHIGHO2_12_FULL_40_19]